MRQERQQAVVHRSSGGERVLRRHPWLLGYLLVAGFATLLVLGLVVERAESAVEQASSWRAREARAAGLLGHLRWQLGELENAERGFILTADPRWGEGCRQGMEAVRQDLLLLRPLVVKGGQRHRLESLQPLVAARLAHLEGSLELRRRQGGGADEILMNEIQRRISALLKGQERMLARGDERLRRRVLRMRWSLLVGLLWCVPPLAFVVRRSRRQLQRWTEAVIELQQANGRAHVP